MFTKITLTEADGTTVETLSTTTGFSGAVVTLTDGTDVTVFPVPVTPTTDPIVRITTLTQAGVETPFVPELG